MSDPANQGFAIPGGGLPFGEVVLPWRRLAPLWRIAVVLGALVLLLVAHTSVRMEAARATHEIRSYQRLATDAESAHAQLQLELAWRSGDTHLLRAADVYGLVPATTVEAIAAPEDSRP